ncbi:hypothetical protein F5B21DRAFT_344473 [Xylaria acuta]|nr:hypothetical protein F5B21DRAFT_344473 [Xylaria acuta]
MPTSLLSSLRALSLRTRQASRVLPTLCRRQPTVRSISQSALAPTQAQRPAIARRTGAMVATMVQQQTRGMKVHSSVKKRCEHCKVSQPLKPRTLSSHGTRQDQADHAACNALNTAWPVPKSDAYYQSTADLGV